MIYFVLQAFDLFGQQLLQADHFASGEVEERLESMAAAREDLEKAWIARRMQLDQCLELQLFYRYRTSPSQEHGRRQGGPGVTNVANN
jgi:hypothetical protein